MYRYIRALIVVGALMAASHAEAAIVINEIAWMGTDAEGGSSCEWIELYNPDAVAVNLSSWTLEIANAGASTPKILSISELDGTSTIVQPYGFFLLARNSGTCLEHDPGSTAEWHGSFGTGISNTGSKLTLRDSAGITMDAVDAEEGWSKSEIGGYNVSGKPKLTPQRNGTAWVTAAPTPQAANATAAEETTSNSGNSASSSSSSSKKISLPPIYIEAGEDRIVSANAHIEYSALVYTDRGSIVNTAKLLWSFGEGSGYRSEGANHVFREPGEYLVNVIAQFGSKTASDSFIVTVDTAELRIAEISEKGIAIENSDDRIIDLSAWKLEADGVEFKIPKGTAILPGRTVYFSPEVTGLPTSNNTSLLYPNGKKMHEYAGVTSEASE